ncbi:MAG: hypothetical protein DIJKHBIC_04261 [Thermoanaerobaculia bacterium]|nr:hypothetical protein [Thermoanaerobaculia bacterium]
MDSGQERDLRVSQRNLVRKGVLCLCIQFRRDGVDDREIPSVLSMQGHGEIPPKGIGNETISIGPIWCPQVQDRFQIVRQRDHCLRHTFSLPPRPCPALEISYPARSAAECQAGVRVRIRNFKIIVEKHLDTYVAYPIGFEGVVAGQGESYEEALSDVRSALALHLESFGSLELDDDTPILEAFVDNAAFPA